MSRRVNGSEHIHNIFDWDDCSLDEIPLYLSLGFSWFLSYAGYEI